MYSIHLKNRIEAELHLVVSVAFRNIIYLTVNFQLNVYSTQDFDFYISHKFLTLRNMRAKTDLKLFIAVFLFFWGTTHRFIK